MARQKIVKNRLKYSLEKNELKISNLTSFICKFSKYEINNIIMN